MKINVSMDDYTWNGMGANSYNFVQNVIPRISRWLVDECIKSKKEYELQEVNALADKIYKIAEIIDEAEDKKEKITPLENIKTKAIPIKKHQFKYKRK